MKTKNKLHLAICFMAIAAFSTSNAQSVESKIHSDEKTPIVVCKKQCQKSVKVLNVGAKAIEDIPEIDVKNIKNNVKEVSVIKGDQVITITLNSSDEDSGNTEELKLMNDEVSEVENLVVSNKKPIALSIHSDELNINEKITLILKSDANVNVMNKEKVKCIIVHSNADETGKSLSEKRSTEHIDELSVENAVSISVTGDEQTSDLKPSLNNEVNTVGPGAKIYTFTALSTDEKLNKIKKAYVVITNENKNVVEVDDSENIGKVNVENLPITSAEESAVNTAGISLKAFPNPSNGVFSINVQTPENTNASLEITDISGKSILREELKGINNDYTHKVDLTSFPKGVYFVSLKQGNNVSELQTVVE